MILNLQIVYIFFYNSQFKGQTRKELGNREVTAIVSRAGADVSKYYLEENLIQARKIIYKVILAEIARHASSKTREIVQYKKILAGSGLL